MMIGLPARPPFLSPFLNYCYFKTQSLTLYQTGLDPGWHQACSNLPASASKYWADTVSHYAWIDFCISHVWSPFLNKTTLRGLI